MMDALEEAMIASAARALRTRAQALRGRAVPMIFVVTTPTCSTLVTPSEARPLLTMAEDFDAIADEISGSMESLGS
jgi:hypothetical protein